MSTAKIKFKLERFKDLVVFQVLWQDKSITCGDALEHYYSYKASNDITVLSAGDVRLGTNEVFIGGSESHVGVAYLKLGSLTEAMTYFDRVLSALKEWASNGYFKECETTEEYDSDTGIWSL